MAAASVANVDNPVPVHIDKVVCRLDLFPELVQALRDGDLLTGRLFCARLFSLDRRRSSEDLFLATFTAASSSSTHQS
jgi:hypothetical protein